MADAHRDELLSVAEVCDLLRVGRTSLWKLERTTDFPTCINFGLRLKRWRRVDILSYIDRCAKM